MKRHTFSALSHFLTRPLLWVAIIVSLVGLSPSSVVAQAFLPGEELEYDVKYLNIKLGTIKIICEKQETFNGKPVLKVRANIDSRPGIPFVAIHTVYNSWMDTSISHSHQFIGSTLKDKNWVYDKYAFDYPNQKITLETGDKDKQIPHPLIQTNRRWNDGLSLFFAARQNLFCDKNISVPTIIEFDTVRTTINFKNAPRESVSIDAVDFPVKTVHFSGDANWTGVYGLSGKFEGWFSDDGARVPIKAKMKVIVGTVDIELVRWKRPGNWQPPKGS